MTCNESKEEEEEEEVSIETWGGVSSSVLSLQVLEGR